MEMLGEVLDLRLESIGGLLVLFEDPTRTVLGVERRDPRSILNYVRFPRGFLGIFTIPLHV